MIGGWRPCDVIVEQRRRSLAATFWAAASRPADAETVQPLLPAAGRASCSDPGIATGGSSPSSTWGIGIGCARATADRTRAYRARISREAVPCLAGVTVRRIRLGEAGRMDMRAPEPLRSHTVRGVPCTHAARTRIRVDTRTTADAESASASGGAVGAGSSDFSPTWVSVPQERRLSATIRTVTTSPGTAGGPRHRSNRITGG